VLANSAYGRRRQIFDLEAITLALGSVESLVITTSALSDATALDFNRAAIVETISGLGRKLFVKSMTIFCGPSHQARSPLGASAWLEALYKIPRRRHYRVYSDLVQGEMRMATKETLFPETKITSETGETRNRDSRQFVVSYKGESTVIDLLGYYPAGDGDGVPTPAAIPCARAKFHLSQGETGAELQADETAFDKYERGLIEPIGSTLQLIKVLDRHPKLVEDLR
jgi:HTH-type transcriptional regulator / antitoxin MqsA